MQNRDRECLLRIVEHCQRILDAQKRFGDSFEKFCSDAVNYFTLLRSREPVNFNRKVQ